MQKYGYIRVSSKDQNPERQMVALLDCGIYKKNIYMDKLSGKDFNRPRYKKLLGKLKKGDLIIVKSVDRLGRNYSEILEQWRYITKDIGVDIMVLDMPLLNTSVSQGDLTGIFISDIVLQILAYFAQTEREFIRQRQAEGIALAKAKGVRFGNQRKEMPEDTEKYYRMWNEGTISLRQAANELSVSRSTFYRRCVEYRDKENNRK